MVPVYMLMMYDPSPLNEKFPPPMQYLANDVVGVSVDGVGTSVVVFPVKLHCCSIHLPYIMRYVRTYVHKQNLSTYVPLYCCNQKIICRYVCTYVCIKNFNDPIIMHIENLY